MKIEQKEKFNSQSKNSKIVNKNKSELARKIIIGSDVFQAIHNQKDIHKPLGSFSIANTALKLADLSYIDRDT